MPAVTVKGSKRKKKMKQKRFVSFMLPSGDDIKGLEIGATTTVVVKGKITELSLPERHDYPDGDGWLEEGRVRLEVSKITFDARDAATEFMMEDD